MKASQHSTNITQTVQTFYDQLKEYIIKKTGDPVLAEDLTQEVMYRLAKADDENREIRNVKAWLFQTTRHVIADHFRDRSRSPLIDSSGSFESETASDQSGFQNLTGLDGFVSISDVDFILPMLKLLPGEYGTPLIMSDIENIPQKKIAGILGLGLSATKMRIKRAREKLHDLFTKCCEIEYDSRGEFAGCTIKDNCIPLWKIKNDLAEKADCNQ